MRAKPARRRSGRRRPSAHAAGLHFRHLTRLPFSAHCTRIYRVPLRQQAWCATDADGTDGHSVVPAELVHFEQVTSSRLVEVVIVFHVMEKSIVAFVSPSFLQDALIGSSCVQDFETV